MARVRMHQQANNNMIVPCDQQGINNNSNRDNKTENDVLDNDDIHPYVASDDHNSVDLSNNSNSGNEDDSDESDEISNRGAWDSDCNASDMRGICPYDYYENGVDEEHNASDWEGIDIE